MKRKGIILAGGSGSRLFPLTTVTSKQLLPIYDKPLIYYSLSTLMESMIKDILIISSSDYIDSYFKLLGDGSKFGINISYAPQEKPDGIAQSFLIGEKFLMNANCCLILGDNIFYGNELSETFYKANQNNNATIFAYHVSDPERYGIVSFKKNKQIISIEEKPKKPKSNYAVTGIYFYDSTVVEYAKTLKPSSRGELEITDLNNLYLSDGKLDIEIFDRGISWIDTGTHQSLLEASQFVSTIERRQGLKIGCPEEIAYKNNWISSDDIVNIASNYPGDYSKYLMRLVESKWN